MATQQGITFLAQILRGFQLSIVNEDQPEKWGRYDPDPAKREGRYSDGLTLGMRHKAEFKVTIV